MSAKSDKSKIKIDLTYKPSSDGDFRLSQALEILISEEDIMEYITKKDIPLKKNKAQKKHGDLTDTLGH